LNFIATDAFSGCNDIIIRALKGTYAYKWAVTNGYNCISPFDYEVINNKYISITQYTGDDVDVIIPSYLIHLPVQMIGAQAFAGRDDIESISIPSSVSSIGEDAFINCTNLKSIVFPENKYFNVFKDYGLRTCPSLKSIYLPRAINKFEKDSLPDNITSYYWNDLDLWVYANTITVEALEKYRKYVYMDEVCFRSPSNPDFVILVKDAETNPSIILYGYKGNDSHITIPQTIDGVKVSRFDTNNDTGFQSERTNGNWAVVTNITIPDGVNTDGWSWGGGKGSAGSFYFCENVESIIYEGYSEIHEYAFKNCEKLQSVVLPTGIDEIPVRLFSFFENLESVVIQNGVKKIDEYAFQYCKNLASISFPDSITNIGKAAFYDCDSLTNISLPGDLTSIGEDAFFSCENLESVYIPNGLTSIGVDAFSFCYKLESINIPSSVTSIGEGAFRYSRRISAKVVENSYAHNYCIENNIKFELIDE